MKFKNNLLKTSNCTQRKFKLLLMSLLMLSVMLQSVSLTAFAATPVNASALKTETQYERTYVATESLKVIGLSTQIKGNSILLSNNTVKIEFTAQSNVVKINGVEMTLDTKPYFKGAVAYVPMKFVFETMNYSVKYQSATKSIAITQNTPLMFPLTIVDSGKSYTFKTPAKRIVSLAPSITEILFAIGAGDKVVGRTKYCAYPAEVSSITAVGTLYEPDLEAILDLEPDTVIAATHMNEDVLKTLEKAKISTLTQASPARIAEIYTLIEQLGRLTNRTYESRALVSSMKSKEERIDNVMKGIPANQKKEVYYVVGTGKSEYTAGKQTFIHEILVKAGCINVGSDVDKWSYSLEKLIDHNPEYLIGADYSFATMNESVNYSSLSALKTGKTIIVNTDVFSIPGPRVIDYSMKTIVEKLYPSYVYKLRF